MKKAILLLALFCSSAFADKMDDIKILSQEAASIYAPDLHYTIPPIVYLSPKELTVRVCGKQCPNDSFVVGLYDGGTIYLRSTWDPHNDTDASYYVHEFVHHLQYLSKVIDPTAKGTCEENVRIEFVAYSVQNQWLMRRGKGFPYRMMQQLSYISAGCNP
jgi:hypothetical protein